MDDVINVILDAGKTLKREFYHFQEFEFKSKYEIVTAIDKKIELQLHSELLKLYPDYGFLGEETGFQSKKEYNWFVDPIDGTTNFTLHNPFFNISVALVKGNEPVWGIVHVPMTNEIYLAEKGKGSFLIHGDDRIKLGMVDVPLEKSILGYCHKGNIEQVLKVYNILKPKVRDIRKFGASALELSLTSAGLLQGFVMINSRPWDIAAGILLVKESGGVVTDFKGKDIDIFSDSNLLAASKFNHSELLNILKDI